MGLEGGSWITRYVPPGNHGALVSPALSFPFPSCQEASRSALPCAPCPAVLSYHGPKTSTDTSSTMSQNKTFFFINWLVHIFYYNNAKLTQRTHWIISEFMKMRGLRMGTDYQKGQCHDLRAGFWTKSISRDGFQNCWDPKNQFSQSWNASGSNIPTTWYPVREKHFSQTWKKSSFPWLWCAHIVILT